MDQDIANMNIQAPNYGAPCFLKRVLMDFKTQINPNLVIVGDFNTPISLNMVVFWT